MTHIQGTVITGEKRGRILNFPTANVLLTESVNPGIYISETSYNSQLYPSLTFIGNAVTFGETDVKSETYILNFNEDIYGKMISVTLLSKIRDNEKFGNAEDLMRAMKHDKKIAEEYFAKRNI